MHRAPAVSFLTARSRWHLRFVLVLATSVGLTLVGFALGQPQSQWQLLILGCAGLVSACMALIDWSRSPVGCLRWDRQHWHWSGWSDSAACGLILRMDWQSGMLVTLQREGDRSLWLWLDARSDFGQWNALRRAIFSGQSIAPGDDGVEASPRHAEVG